MMSNFAAVSNGSTSPPYFTVEQVPIASVPSNGILIKAMAFAVNPTDWKHLANGRGDGKGVILGSDVSGIVEVVGSEVSGFQKGDFVSAWIHGNYKVGQGAYQNYVVVDPVTTLKFNKTSFQETPLPVGTSPLAPVSTFEGAASLALGLSTVGMSFNHCLKIKANQVHNKNSYILIWGGATATGILAIQIAKFVYGVKVVATASAKNFEYLKSLGADVVVDYNDKNVVAQIRLLCGENIKWALDTVASLETLQSTYDATSESEFVAIDQLLYIKPEDLKLDPNRSETVKFTQTLAYLVFGETTLPVENKIPAPELAVEFREFWRVLLPPFLPNLRTAKLRVLKSGLESAGEAYALLQEGKVSGEKVVWRV